jgi:hypothetical protein
MNKNNINFQVHRTTEGTVCEAVCGLLLLLSLIFSMIIMHHSKEAGAGMLIQTGIIALSVVLILVLAYAPHTFNIPDDSPAELFVATVRFLRYTAVLTSMLSLGITLSAFLGFPGGIVPSLFGICFVPLMCWYFYVYFKAKHHHG